MHPLSYESIGGLTGVFTALRTQPPLRAQLLNTAIGRTKPCTLEASRAFHTHYLIVFANVMATMVPNGVSETTQWVVLFRGISVGQVPFLLEAGFWALQKQPGKPLEAPALQSYDPFLPNTSIFFLRSHPP